MAFADLIQLGTNIVGFPEVGAKSTLSVVYVDHAKPPVRLGSTYRAIEPACLDETFRKMVRNPANLSSAVIG
jgi:hypothetical protein